MAVAPPLPSEVDLRVGRLSTASLRRIIEPDVDLAGSVGPGIVLPRELLSVADLDLRLSDEQWTKLSREELASILDAGVRFESVLMAGFGMMLAWRKSLLDPRVTYILHEVGEETRHSRLFLRVVGQLEPTAKNPFFRFKAWSRFERWMTSRQIQRHALFCVLVLTGEEGPDLIQKQFVEHGETDPFVCEVSRYHRVEEARHLSFARMLLPEAWKEASRTERFVVRHLAPLIMTGLFDSLVHPGVYRTVGLPGWRTWNAARNSPSRRKLRAESFQPVCDALRNAGAFGPHGRVPRAWRRACRLDES